jgi:hypothetical protein
MSLHQFLIETVVGGGGELEALVRLLLRNEIVIKFGSTFGVTVDLGFD